jgi:hypothetical protein
MDISTSRIDSRVRQRPLRRRAVESPFHVAKGPHSEVISSRTFGACQNSTLAITPLMGNAVCDPDRRSYAATASRTCSPFAAASGGRRWGVVRSADQAAARKESGFGARREGASSLPAVVHCDSSMERQEARSSAAFVPELRLCANRRRPKPTYPGLAHEWCEGLRRDARRGNLRSG